MSNILKMLKYGPYSPNYDFQTYIDERTYIKGKHATKEKNAKRKALQASKRKNRR